MRSAKQIVLGAIHITALSMPAILIDNGSHAATLTPVAQERNIQAMVIVPPCNPAFDSENDSAIGFNPFTSEVDAASICSMALGLCAASQNSQINAASITASGATSCDVLAKPNPATIHAIPTSNCSVTFQLTPSVRYFIEGELAAVSDIQMIFASASVRLLDSDNTVIEEHSVTAVPGAGTNTLTVQESGSLPAGQYRLMLHGRSLIDATVPPNGEGESSFSISARFQRPGDANIDGSVNADDLIAVILAWGSCPAAPAFCPIDMDESGAIDADDLVLVIMNWG
jgi:hypothetical protein